VREEIFFSGRLREILLERKWSYHIDQYRFRNSFLQQPLDKIMFSICSRFAEKVFGEKILVLPNREIRDCKTVLKFVPVSPNSVEVKLFRNRIEVGKLYCTRILLNSPETETRDSSSALKLGSRL